MQDLTGKKHADARSAARDLIAKGYAPIPYPRRSKHPILAGWPDLRVETGAVDSLFRADANLGVLLGEPSGGLIDVDLDCVEARRVAPLLLPATEMISGRESASDSHRWYVVSEPPERAAEKFIDPVAKPQQGRVLLELRSTGAVTIVPPSVYPAEPAKGHPTEERCVWSRSGDPAPLNVLDLRLAVATTAAAALLGRYWPTGARHDAALALAGALQRACWDTPRIERFIRAVCAAAEDPEVEDRVRCVLDTATRDSSDPTTGWTTLARQIGANGGSICATLREWLNVIAVAAVVTEPHSSLEAEWPAPPHDHAYYGLAGEFVRAIEPVTEADPVALLVQFQSYFGNLVGRGPHFRTEADAHFCNEFFVLVGRTSKGRKGTSRGHVHGIFAAAEPTWADLRVVTGLSSSEGLIWVVRDPIEKLEKIRDRGQPVRYETVVADPGESDKRLLVYEPEFANVLKQSERQGNTLSAVLRQAWDTDSLRTLTKNSPAKATGAHISIIGHITSEELHRYLTATESANGFANRFFWVAVQRSKLLPFGGRPDPRILSDIQVRLGNAIACARPLGEIRRTDEADEMWAEVYPRLSSDRPGLACDGMLIVTFSPLNTTTPGASRGSDAEVISYGTR